MHSVVDSCRLYYQGLSWERLHFLFSSAFVFISLKCLKVYKLSGRSTRTHSNGVEVNILSQQLYSVGNTICNYFQVHKDKSKAPNIQLQCINTVYYQCFSSVGLNASYKSKVLQTILQVRKLNYRELKLPFQTSALNQHHPGKVQAS